MLQGGLTMGDINQSPTEASAQGNGDPYLPSPAYCNGVTEDLLTGKGQFYYKYLDGNAGCSGYPPTEHLETLSDYEIYYYSNTCKCKKTTTDSEGKFKFMLLPSEYIVGQHFIIEVRADNSYVSVKRINVALVNIVSKFEGAVKKYQEEPRKKAHEYLKEGAKCYFDIERNCYIDIENKITFDYVNNTHVDDSNIIKNSFNEPAYTYKLEGKISHTESDKTIDIGEKTILNAGDNHMEAAMNIYHWIKRGCLFYEKTTGKSPVWNRRTGYTVFWPNQYMGMDIKDTSESFPNELNAIVFADQYPSTICHEHGHQIMFQFARSLIYLKVDDSGNDSYDFGSSTNHTLKGSCNNKVLAYSEGFADFFSCAVRESAKYKNVDLSELINPINIVSYLETDDIEFYIARVLWELYTRTTRMDYKEIDDIFRKKPRNFNEFYNNLVENREIVNRLGLTNIQDVFEKNRMIGEVGFDVEYRHNNGAITKRIMKGKKWLYSKIEFSKDDIIDHMPENYEFIGATQIFTQDGQIYFENGQMIRGVVNVNGKVRVNVR